uniref:Helicase C-terminal domain-containing protein n=1 Tax=Corethron hystrix TaxID=216773 RepID=A0A7S1BD22_9STRA|mmetsp:Transcript_22553/g.51634  ORF Transcript_22553/g.51634 Transcript_22553/m.51634 type:complete len:448 (+) Transcript_22553:3-1346(+)
MDDHPRLSGKMAALARVLRRFYRERGRVLVFSSSTTTLGLIESYVRMNYEYLRMDGSTPTGTRQALVDEYQTNERKFCFLISTKAGGLGLNLTAANKVVIYDVSWNPTSDEQAQDRSYRIGQQRDVEVVRLVARGTIEELKYAHQLYKVQLAQQTLGTRKEASDMVRMFRGVEGDQGKKGELFGAENLLQFRDGEFIHQMWRSFGEDEDADRLRGEDELLATTSAEPAEGEVEEAEAEAVDAEGAGDAPADPPAARELRHGDVLSGALGGAPPSSAEMGGGTQAFHAMVDMQDIEADENGAHANDPCFEDPCVDDPCVDDPIVDYSSVEDTIADHPLVDDPLFDSEGNRADATRPSSARKTAGKEHSRGNSGRGRTAWSPDNTAAAVPTMIAKEVNAPAHPRYTLMGVAPDDRKRLTPEEVECGLTELGIYVPKYLRIRQEPHKIDA